MGLAGASEAERGPIASFFQNAWHNPILANKTPGEGLLPCPALTRIGDMFELLARFSEHQLTIEANLDRVPGGYGQN